jgi:hypothetical protein
MTQIKIDAATMARLNGLSDSLEICDESGRLLGYFHPSVSPPRRSDGKIASPFSDAELARRSQQRTGRPLKDILAELPKP